MDNIQKMIVGSLGLVGLIVLIVPNSDPLASKKTEVGQANSVQGAPPPAVPPPPLPPPAQGGTASGGFVVDDSDIANFGKPMVDPTPPGQRNQQLTQEQIQPTRDQTNNGVGQTQSNPGVYGQQPMADRPAPLSTGLQPPT